MHEGFFSFYEVLRELAARRRMEKTMKKLFSLILVLAVMLGSVAALASCGAPEDDGAEISVYLGRGVYDLDPSDYYVSDNAAQLLSLIYEPLFRLDEDGDLKCAAADDYEVDEDKRLITVTLRETYWSDGMRVKAEDYVYAWRNIILNSENANPAAALLYDIENAVEVKNGASIDELGLVPRVYDLEITYREGADYEQLLKNLACVATAPVRQDVVNLAPDHWSKSSETIVTNGPFMVRSLNYATAEDSTNGVLTLERNKGFHQSPSAEDFDKEVTPYLLMSTFTVGDKAVSITYDALVNNTVFYLGDASLEERKANKDDAIVGDLASTYTYVFNQNNKLFQNKNVRRALSLALDRAKMVEAITFGKPATALLPEFSAETLGGVQELLSSGAKANEANELLASVDFTGLDKTIDLVVDADPESVAMAALAKQSWEALNAGFTVNVIAVDFTKSDIVDKVEGTTISVYDSTVQYYVKGDAEYHNHFKDDAEYNNYNFDIIGFDLQTYSTDGFVALSQFSSGLNGNGVDLVGETNKIVRRATLGGWKNDAYDKLIKEAYETTDSDVKEEKLCQAEKLLVEEAPVIPVVFNQSFAFVSGELKDIEVDGFGHFILTEAELKNYQDYISKE